MGDRIEPFPIFPLPLVLLPAEVVPLHIFEERYKRMINACLADAEPFGVVWLGDEGLAETGCTARISELLERTDDGRMNILVEGERPFRLVRRIDDLPFPAGEVELLDDEPDAPQDHSEAVRSAYAEVVERATEQRPTPDELAAIDAYGMAARIELDPPFKQRLLECRSEDARLGIVETLFGDALRKLEQAARLAAIAQTNGSARP